MRVLFLTLYPEPAASPRYRVAQYLPYLRDHDVECTVACALTVDQYERYSRRAQEGSAMRYHVCEAMRRVTQLVSCGNYDIVFVQKAIMSAYVQRMATLLGWRCRRIVYDIDDAVNLTPPHPLGAKWGWLEEPGQVNKIMSRADLVIAGNAWLASVAEAAGGRAEVLPTVVDTERFVPGDSNDEVYRVGWIGNASTSRSLSIVGDALSSFAHADVRIIGGDPEQAGLPNAEYRAWSLETEVEELQALSVGLMPLPKDEWSRGKCALKAIQYMACGVPCVATPFGAVRDIIRHEENGLFADSPEEWRDALRRLRDPELRARLGAAARETIEAEYSLSVAAPRMHALLESVM